MLPKITFKNLEREMGFEPTTLTLARLHSTTELFPHRALLQLDFL